MRYKSCPAFKVAGDGGDGTFEAIVSVFGNVDYAGDVVMPGAFADTIAAWKASGDPIPVLWSHRTDDPRFSIGTVLDIAELAPHDSHIPDFADQALKDNGGLWVKGQLDMGTDATDVAVGARKLLRERRVKRFSYAYDVLDAGWGTVGGQEAYELRKLDLFEVSPTQIGANNLTELVGSKAAALIASAPKASPERFQHLLSDLDDESLNALLGHLKALRKSRTTDGTDTANGATVKDEEPSGVKSEEPARRESARVLSQILEMEMEYVS